MNDELEMLLPHGPPMILLSGCEPEGEDDAAVAYVEVTRESPFFDHEAGGVPGCVALEYMAQTMALSSGRKRRRAGLPPAIGFVLGSRRMTVSIPFFREGRRYRVRAKCAYSDEEYGAFDCSVEDQDGAVVASAQITAYQPEAGEL